MSRNKRYSAELASFPRQTTYKKRDPKSGSFVSKYDPEFAAQILEYMAQGFTFTATCGRFGVHRRTVYDWIAAHPEFKYAVEIARTARQAHFEKELLKADNPERIKAAIFALKTMKSDDWKEPPVR